MYRHHQWQDDASADGGADRQTASLAAMVIILLLLVGGLFLVHELRTSTLIEDCLLAGRRNCDSLVTGRH